MIQHHVHIRSTDQFNQVGVHEKNDRDEINSMDDHRVWLCIRFTFSSSIGKVYGLSAHWFVLTEFEVLLAVFLLLSVVAHLSSRAFPNMPQSSLIHCGKADVRTIGYLQPNMAGTSNDQIL